MIPSKVMYHLKFLILRHGQAICSSRRVGLVPFKVIVCFPCSFAVSMYLGHMKRGCGPYTLELELDPGCLALRELAGPIDVTLRPLTLCHSSDNHLIM